jgi:transcriptional repressor NrdR
MKCPFCNKDNDKVLESRTSESGEVIRRRRECLSCHKRFTSYEKIIERPLWVIKKNGEKEIYDRGKLFSGITRACHKRSIPIFDIERVVGKIEKDLHKEKGREVKSYRIGEIALKYLKKIDRIAYIRFASVYKQFNDVSEFVRELKEVT